MGEAVYVYGVMPAARVGSLDVRGVKGGEVRLVEQDGLAALVSPMRGDELAAASEVRAHWRVLDELVREVTVLPVRFGTVMDGDDAVREGLLGANSERLRALVAELDGKVQLTVKGDYHEQPLLREAVRASPEVARLRERIRGLPEAAGYYDRIRLGELVAAEVAKRRERDTRRALELLEPHAVEAREETPSGPDAAFNLAFLVERGAQERFTEAVRALATELSERTDIRYIGPLPPYSFADVELSTGSAAWA
ncbi:MAG TPA: GvpL/GvpF family gas vesicle protein [Thermoleophilaceae bacterium]|nr:GvpL/GvpF family gas vesicle protein [Thermoleophilaceae bacterium]